MERYTKLDENFYALDLYYGKTNLTPNRNFQCFFIVEHPCSEDFIREQALALLMSQCKNFDFYGNYSKQWDIGFDMVDIQLHPNNDDTDVALTSQWDCIDDFVDALEIAISTRYFVPCDIYLIYDDENAYREVLGKLRFNRDEDCHTKSKETYT